MTVQEVLVTLERWRAAGWLRDLDVALARFVAETDARAPASLVLAIALVAHMEGRGHTGLMLPALATGMTVADRHANVGPGAALVGCGGWAASSALRSARSAALTKPGPVTRRSQAASLRS